MKINRLKAIQVQTYGPLHLLQSIQLDNQTFHLLQAIQHELHHKHGTITDSVCFRNSLTYAKRNLASTSLKSNESPYQ